jgi:hypothetical protein
MTSFFSNYTCEYNLAEQSIYCCTYSDEYSCPVKAEWRFCPYCGCEMRATFTQSQPLLPPSPPPEQEYVSPPRIAKPEYVPPPRIAKAEKFWPFMVCKAIVRQITHYSGEKINYRSHYALLSYLAKRYSMTIEKLVDTNPLDIVDTFHLQYSLKGGRWYGKYSSWHSHYSKLERAKL